MSQVEISFVFFPLVGRKNCLLQGILISKFLDQMSVVFHGKRVNITLCDKI